MKPVVPDGITNESSRSALKSFGWVCAIIGWVSFIYISATVATYVGIMGWQKLMDVSLAETLETTLLLAISWVLTLGLLFISSRYVLKLPVTLDMLGMRRLLDWRDLGVGILGLLPYLFLAWVFITIASSLVPGFDIAQDQDVGFSAVFSRVDMLLAFTSLIVIAPVVEEMIFRGYMYSALRERRVPVWLVWLVVSALFGVAHGQWNVGINVFALSLVLCAFRQWTGSIWAGVVLHMAKNGIAFYLLYISPGIL